MKATVILTAAFLLAGIQPVPAQTKPYQDRYPHPQETDDLPTYPLLVPNWWQTGRWLVDPAPLPKGWDAIAKPPDNFVGPPASDKLVAFRSAPRR